VIHLSKPVPVSVSVKLPASQVKLKPDLRIWWNHPRSRFHCRNRKKMADSDKSETYVCGVLSSL